MPAPDYSVRPATPSDISALSAVLARAFATAEPFLWIEPRQDLREALLRGYFTGWLTHVYKIGWGSEVALRGNRIIGGTIWVPPGRWNPGTFAQLLGLVSIVREVGLFGMGNFLSRGRAVSDAINAAHMSEPHWYLYILGNDPDMQGHGVGAALVQSGLARAARDRLPAYLECVEPLVPFYVRQGFRREGDVNLPPGAAPQTRMIWRPEAMDAP